MIETTTQAVNLLISGIHLAQKRGAFELKEAALFSEAIEFLEEISKKNEERKVMQLEKIRET